MAYEIRRLAPDLWPDLETLFGPRGAAAGCWCQWVMLRKGETFDQIKGETAHRRLETQVRGGERRGLLAYADGGPVGWLAYGPRTGFPRIDRAPSLAAADAEQVWSVGCFFIKAGWRGRGVASALLDGALSAIAEDGGRTVEGYPVRLAAGERQAAAFVWTGTTPLFEKHGFVQVDQRIKGKVRMRRRVGADHSTG